MAIFLAFLVEIRQWLTVWQWWQRWQRRAQARRDQEEERWERIEARRAAYRDREQTNTVASVATALGGALDRTFQIESKLLEQMGGFLGVLEEASAKKAASVLGARGGRAAQAKKKRLPAPPTCPLCKDPLRRDVTVEMVQAHRNHGASEAGERVPNGPDN